MIPAAKMSKKELKEKLDALQCHFTWKLGVVNVYNPQHLLQKLDVEINHMAHQNKVAFLGLQAYLHHLNNQSAKALQSLRDAEEENNKEQQPASTAGSLLIYGNYAWIHYLQGSHQEAQTCLGRVEQLRPVPWDVQLVPHIQAQKGWSLLVIRAHNGERARECFEQALMLQPEDTSFRTGLGMALYSSWKFSWQPDNTSEAISQLQRIVDEQPSNYRAKIYLAGLLQHKDEKKSSDLIEECRKSSDPEVLRLIVLLWIPGKINQAVEIAKKAVEDHPGYHLLYQALAKSYKQQWLQAHEKDKSNKLDEAIRHLQQIVDKHPGLDMTIVKLHLAELIGEKDPAKEEKIYQKLQEEIDPHSLKCRQALNLFWGKHFIFRGGSQDEAKTKLMEGYRISLQTGYRKDCGRRLRKMASKCQRNNDADTAKDIYSFLQKADQHLPGRFAELSLEDGDLPHPAE